VNLGAQVSVPIANRLEFYPSFDWYFVDPGSTWAVNADLKWRVAKDQPRWLYLGGGLDLMVHSLNGISSSKAGVNILGGIESLRGWVHPFAEIRGILSDNSSVQLQGGLNITLGRH